MSTTDSQVLSDLLLATLLSRKYRSSDQLPTIENLILNGADVNCLDHQGTSLIARVLSSSIKECGGGFFSRTGNADSRRFIACLQSHGADIFVKLEGGQSILHYLFSKPRHFLFISHQLLNYCDIYFGDEIISLCRFLDSQGLSLDALDDQGNSAFSLLIQSLGEEVTTVIKNNYNKPLLHYHQAIKSLLKLVKNISSHIGEAPLLDYVGGFDKTLQRILQKEIETRVSLDIEATAHAEDNTRKSRQEVIMSAKIW